MSRMLPLLLICAAPVLGFFAGGAAHRLAHRPRPQPDVRPPAIERLLQRADAEQEDGWATQRRLAVGSTAADPQLAPWLALADAIHAHDEARLRELASEAPIPAVAARAQLISIRALDAARPGARHQEERQRARAAFLARYPTSWIARAWLAEASRAEAANAR